MIDLAQPTTEESPFHDGEQRIQQVLGVREEMELWGRRVVRPYMFDQHAEFYSKLPYVVAAARDDRGRPRATLLTGDPGFLNA